jgi:serine/threonine protein kinase
MPVAGSVQRQLLDQGARIGRFEIKQHLGGGSVGEVYLAYDQCRKTEVALKVVAVGPVDSDAVAAQLCNEITAYDAVQDHTHVLKIHDMHSIPWGGSSLLVLSMEYAEGGTLGTWLREHQGDWEARRIQGLEYFEQLCLGTGALHKAGWAALDITPRNALFVRGVLKVADLGMSLVISSMGGDPESADDSHHPGFGTPIYMSPQQFTASRRSDLDARADIYSLGVILFEILDPKGLPPFRGDYRRLRDLHMEAPPPALPQATESQARAIRRCLAKDASARYASVDELLSDLAKPPCPPHGGLQDSAEGLVNQLLEDATDAVSCGQLNDALRICSEILDKAPGNRETTLLQQELKERFRQAEQFYQAITAGLDSLNLDELMDLLTEAVEAFPEHPAGPLAQIKIASKLRQFREAIKEGMCSGADGHWTEAMAPFERAEQINPGWPTARTALRMLTKVLERKEEHRALIDQAVAGSQWDRAQALARDLDEYLDNVSRTFAASMMGEGDRE